MNAKGTVRSMFSILLACICLVLSLPMTAVDASTEEAPTLKKVVRVGFPIQENMTEKTEKGEYTGYTVDYLNELIKYTDWEIEYVEVEGTGNEQVDKLGNMLINGEIDMMGTMYLNDYLQELYLYPTYSYGNTYTALTVSQTSSRWQSDDVQSWNGMRVATCPTLKRRTDQLEQYALMSGFTYELVEYETTEQVCDAVRKGDADACVQVDISIADGLRTIARFHPTPYYFALNKERTDLLKDLNTAMYAILEGYPSLQSELYSHYFLHKGSFNLSAEDRKWLETLPPLRVLYYTGNAPLQDARDGKPTGIASSFFHALSVTTGLKVEPVFAHNYKEGIKLISSGAIDAIAMLPNSSEIYSEIRMRRSVPYFESTAVWVSDGSVLEGEPAKRQYLSANIEQELYALRRNQAKASLLDAYSVSFYLRKKVVYDGIHVEWTDRNSILYSVGFMNSVDDRLVSIVNGFSNSLTEQVKQDMLYSNSREPIHYTFEEYLEIYKGLILLSAAGLILLTLYLLRVRRNRIQRENAIEMEHLHQFSLMTNECIIKYDVKQDRLIMQNNTLVFQDREVIQPFLSEDAQIELKTENERKFAEQLREMLRNEIKVVEIELIQDGEPRWFKLSLAYVSNEYTIGRLSDIHEEVEHRTQLEREANYDALTGMMNRTALHHHVMEHLTKNSSGIFLLLDLDNFKKVNDTKGHREGDKVLQAFSEFLQTHFHTDDYKARLGGDEFVIFLPVKMSEKELREYLDAFLQDVAKRVFADYQDCGLSVSVGAAFVQENLSSFEDLYRAADSAMYMAKYGGKNGYFISDGAVCEHETCDDCDDPCRKRDYLIAHGVTDPSCWNP